MNDTTRETLERLSIECLRRMDRTLLQIRRVNSELDRLRAAQKKEMESIEEYLDMIEKGDPRFNRDAWLNHAQQEMI